jgi:hypothetical protein
MRMRKKQDLPSKLCACCGLPFTWRKKWARDWASVKFCSDRCRQQGAGNGGAAKVGSTASPLASSSK